MKRDYMRKIYIVAVEEYEPYEGLSDFNIDSSYRKKRAAERRKKELEEWIEKESDGYYEKEAIIQEMLLR